MSWRGILVTLGLVLAAAASYSVLNMSSQTVTTPPATEEPERSYYLKAAKITSVGSTGKPLYELTAAYVRHNPGDNSISLTKIQMDYRAADESFWILEADEGTIPSTHDIIELWGNVRASGKPSGEQKLATILRAEALTLDPGASLASSDGEVEIELDGKRLSGTGMRAYLKDDRLELKSNVHGHFTPEGSRDSAAR